MVTRVRGSHVDLLVRLDRYYTYKELKWKLRVDFIPTEGFKPTAALCLLFLLLRTSFMGVLRRDF